MPPSQLPLLAPFADLLEAAVQRFLALAPNAGELLEPLAGKQIALDLRHPPLSVVLTGTGRGFQIDSAPGNPADVCLTGSWLGFLRVRLSASPEQGLFGGDIRIDGDMKTARSFQRLLDHLAIDWHGFLAGAIGSAPAAGLLELLGATRRWSADTGAALRQDAAEYLQEEVRALPSPAEGEEWLRAVDTLRADADRLEARIDRLRAASTPKS